MASKNRANIFRHNPLHAALAPLRANMARDEARASRRRLEDLAKEVGADLRDPEQFRMVQELAAS